jgi:hypothetical protein
MTVAATEFRNDKAVFFWAFTAFFDAGVAAMAFLFWRDGLPANYAPWLSVSALILFIGAAVMLTIIASGKCRTSVQVLTDGRAQFLWRYPWRTVTHTCSRLQVTPAVLVESRDSEGEPYFRAQVSLHNGLIAELAEGHQRAFCVAACERFNQQMMSQNPSG